MYTIVQAFNLMIFTFSDNNALTMHINDWTSIISRAHIDYMYTSKAIIII